LGGAHEGHAIHSKFSQHWPILLESSKLFLDVVLKQVTKALLVASGQSPELSLKQLGVKDLS
jgi:hypothetical protein